MKYFLTFRILYIFNIWPTFENVKQYKEFTNFHSSTLGKQSVIRINFDMFTVTGVQDHAWNRQTVIKHIKIIPVLFANLLFSQNNLCMEWGIEEKVEKQIFCVVWVPKSLLVLQPSSIYFEITKYYLNVQGQLEAICIDNIFDLSIDFQ